MEDRVCIDCLMLYTPTGPAQKRCVTCQRDNHLAYQRRAQIKYRASRGKPVGVGKGGSNKKGEDHKQFSTGMCIFYKWRRKLKDELNECQRCGKDLSTASRYEWACHHKDGERKNNHPSNFELLCKRCHQVEHDCHLAFI